MYGSQIVIMLDSFSSLCKQAIEKGSKNMFLKKLHMYAMTGKHSPQNIVHGKYNELMGIMKTNELCLSALCGNLGSGYVNSELNFSLNEKSKRTPDLAKKIDADMVSKRI